tara:strand:+ start:1165 stop:1347 length:183 start_codon:yes stop_codon:yes gene_type:complete
MKTTKQKLEFLERKIDDDFEKLKSLFLDIIVRTNQYNELNNEDVKRRLEESYEKIKNKNS